MQHNLIQSGFDTLPITMEPMWLVAYQAPLEDVDRIFDEITKHTSLTRGKTDRNAYRATAGTEYYRPRAGTPTGAEEDVRHRPGVDEVKFYLPKETAILEQVINAIYAVHSYYEPVITVQEVLRSSCKGLNDRDNPHRWWNNDGDWKKSDAKNAN